MFGVKNGEGIARTKLLISDEGGTGKTSTCLQFDTLVYSNQSMDQ